MTDTVLVVEDEMFIALDIEAIVLEAGYAVDGPYATLRDTLAAIDRAMPDCAILDVNLCDAEVYAAADQLYEAGVPIIFHSGHANTPQLRSRYPSAMVCSKPTAPATLRAALDSQIAGPELPRVACGGQISL